MREWIKQFEEQFSERELEYQTVHKASIAAQLKDSETGNLHLHNLTYKAKDATDLVIKTFKTVQKHTEERRSQDGIHTLLVP